MSRGAVTQLLKLQSPLTKQLLQSAAPGTAALQTRPHGGGVPEYWGKDSPYHPGTEFLGTPPDHLKLVAKRPVSPHVFEIDNKSFHYKMPINAITSVTNRFTGVALSVGFTGAGWIALTGDLPAAVAAFKASYPLLVYPAKAAVAFPFVYHYVGGVRHLFWDKAKYGNMANKNSPLDLKALDRSSYFLVGASAIGTLGLTLYSI